MLSYAIILLNTSLHNPNVKQNEKMKFDQFLKMTKGIDNGHDINLFCDSMKSVKLQIDSKDPNAYTDEAFVHDIFVHGFVHCDAHPGNIMVRPNPKDPKNPQIVLLDHGFYET